MKNVTINQLINEIKEQESLFNSELNKVKFVETDEQDKMFLTNLGAIFSEKIKDFYREDFSSEWQEAIKMFELPKEERMFYFSFIYSRVDTTIPRTSSRCSIFDLTIKLAAIAEVMRDEGRMNEEGFIKNLIFELSTKKEFAFDYIMDVIEAIHTMEE